MSSNTVLFDLQDKVAVITLNRPEVRNAMNRDLSQALLEALQQRRARLQPEDLAAVEANLDVIDRALAEVRQALARSPESPELGRMLVSTHRKKVEVLSRVVKLSTAL